ncbi:hypothetical protein [Mycobacteroides abscessus]|uniref:hypothetical protein n=1 Tax=Mycobacteroides abscessus TaxID=36809 RepID=UPI001F1732C8|nr:hypothetical protein [Mycobacteroides abscessus]
MSENMFSDPAAAAWVAAGRPSVAATTKPGGVCGRCGTSAPTVPSSRIISEFFTGFEDWPYGLRRLCVPCAWAHSHPPAAGKPLVITTDSVTKYSAAYELTAILSAGPLPVDHSVIVPSPDPFRRRHILPAAQWGHLVTDGLLMHWDAMCAHRLTDVQQLRRLTAQWLHGITDPGTRRSLGSSWSQLCRPTPHPDLLTSQPASDWDSILRAWTTLQPWRHLPPIWVLARSLTDPPQPQRPRLRKPR